MKISAEAKKAIMIGSVCSLSYFAVYIARNILGAVTPQLTQGGIFTTEQIGRLSSIYFVVYAVGQLINGMIGDKIKAKYMISTGLVFAGICSLLFCEGVHSLLLTYVAYGGVGFFLSMIYGPMTRVVAENTEPPYTTRCSLGYTFSSFFGSPLAGVLAGFLVWHHVFTTSSIMLVLMGCFCFALFTSFEKKGVLHYTVVKKQEKRTGGIRVLIQHQIIKFTLIALLTGVVRTTVVFWLPTYLSEYLGFSAQEAAFIFTVATFIISMNAFIAIFLYERLGSNMNLTILISFVVATIGFLCAAMIRQPVWNIVMVVIGILFGDCAATMLWSRYCPGLKDTGMVSSATGFLDFMSYMAASVSSTLFANAVSVIGWQNLVMTWFGLMALGVIVVLPYKKRIAK